MREKSFTIIELLVVIAVIGLLSSIIVVSTQGSKERARIGKALAFSGNVQRAMGAYAVASYNFNDANPAVATDSSGNGNNGAINGASPASGIPELGNALSFDGNDFVQLPLANTLQIVNKDFTVEAWVKVSAYDADDETILGTDEAAANTGLHLVIRNQKPYMGFYGNDTAGNAVLSAGAWHHLVWVYTLSNGEQRMYADGVTDGVTTGHAAFQGTGIVRIGRWAGGHYFDGLIDEVRIYSQALSLSEIQKHYAEGLDRHQLAVNQ